jgi:hypothetical protein
MSIVKPSEEIFALGWNRLHTVLERKVKERTTTVALIIDR